MNNRQLLKEILCTGNKVIIKLDGREGEIVQIMINYETSIQYLIEYCREGNYETRWFFPQQVEPIELSSFYKLYKYKTNNEL